jgi:hypothetical protein
MNSALKPSQVYKLVPQLPTPITDAHLFASKLGSSSTRDLLFRKLGACKNRWTHKNHKPRESWWPLVVAFIVAESGHQLPPLQHCTQLPPFNIRPVNTLVCLQVNSKLLLTTYIPNEVEPLLKSGKPEIE